MRRIKKIKLAKNKITAIQLFFATKGNESCCNGDQGCCLPF